MPNEKTYSILVKSDKGCVYDTLLCNICMKTCKRGNYTEHKKTKLHIDNLEKNKNINDATNLKPRHNVTAGLHLIAPI